jgi:hypothetical protein
MQWIDDKVITNTDLLGVMRLARPAQATVSPGEREIVQTAVGYVQGMRKTTMEDLYLATTKPLLLFLHVALPRYHSRATTATLLSTANHVNSSAAQ